MSLRMKLIVFVALMLSTAPALAADLLVDTTVDEFDVPVGNQTCSLREAIESVNVMADVGGCMATGPYTVNDTIMLPMGTFDLDRALVNEDANVYSDLDVLADVQIIGAGSGSTTINNLVMDRVLDIHASAASVDVMGVAIAGGALFDPDPCGGGVRVSVSTVTFVDVVIEQNDVLGPGTDGRGAGLCNLNGTVNLTDSSVRFNTVGGTPFGRGGGIYTTGPSSSLSLSMSTVSSNNATSAPGPLGSAHGAGGGIFHDGGTVEIALSEIQWNEVLVPPASPGATEDRRGFGGGIYTSRGDMTITDTRILDNGIGPEDFPASSSGGGMYIADSTVLIVRSSLERNDVSADSALGPALGAAIYASAGNDGVLEIRNSTLHFNEIMALGTGACGAIDCGGSGAGLFHWDGPVWVSHTTFAVSNNAGFAGRGDSIWYSGGTNSSLQIISTILGSLMGGNGNCSLTGGMSVTPSEPIMSLGFNVASTGGCNFGAVGDIDNVDPMVGSCGDNGGPLMPGGNPTDTCPITMASPAWNRATTCEDVMGVAVTVDQRMFSRPAMGSECDSGSFELQ